MAKKLLVSFVTGLAFLPAASFAEMPRYDVDAHCKVIAAVGGTYSEAMFDACFDMEQTAYNYLKPKWGKAPNNLQAHCDQIARVGGGGSYSMLEGCFQMEQEASSTNKTFKY